MLKRGTLLLLLSAIALGGAVLLLENQVGPQSEEQASGNVQTTDSKKLFPFEEDEVEQFSVTRQPETESSGEQATETLSFVKTEAGTWEMTEPEKADAEGGAIAFLLSQVSTPTAVPVSAAANNLEEFGLAKPEATVSVTANGNEYVLYVGGLDFQGDRRYVQTLENPAESAAQTEQAAQQDSDNVDVPLNIYAISGSIISAVQRPTEDWLLADDTAVEPDKENEAATSDTDTNKNSADKTSVETTTEAPSPEESSSDGTSETETADTEEPSEETGSETNAADTENSTDQEDTP